MTTNFWQTSKIRLRAVEPSDAELFYRWNMDSERARLLDFLWPPTSLASQQAFTERETKQHMENDTFRWIIENSEGIPVGSIDTHHCSLRNGTFSYGVDVAAEHRGKGYAGEAIRLVLSYYFSELRYQKCTVEVHADNPASIHLHEKLGFMREGVLSRMVYTQGRYVDMILFGLTIEAFQGL